MSANTFTPTIVWSSNLFAAPRGSLPVSQPSQVNQEPRTSGHDAIGISTLGQDGLSTLGGALGLVGTALGAYHGYKRNNSVGWAIVWGLLGGAFPIITIPVAVGQGFGQPASPARLGVATRKR